jgi:predicted transcriptional regulator
MTRLAEFALAFWPGTLGFAGVDLAPGVNKGPFGMDEQHNPGLVELTARIVSAYVSNNTVVAGDLPQLISDTHAALARTSTGAPPPEREELKPKVAVKKSVMPDYIICLEDGKKFKSLKRHLRTHYNLSPEEYREKWGLPHDYPMVAPNYARARSDLAKKMGLGTRREKD